MRPQYRRQLAGRNEPRSPNHSDEIGAVRAQDVRTCSSTTVHLRRYAAHQAPLFRCARLHYDQTNSLAAACEWDSAWSAAPACPRPC